MSLRLIDYLVMSSLGLLAVLGIYQFYFWTQRHQFFKARHLKTFIDDWFGFHPSWIWVYAGLYYVFVVLSLVLSVQDMRHLGFVIFSFFLLVLALVPFWIFFPVDLPDAWRQLARGQSLSERFVRLVKRIDGRLNCFPSLHVSAALLAALHLQSNLPQLGAWVLIFPGLVALSVLYTKQHYFVDVPAGLALGWLVFLAYEGFYYV